MLSKGIAIIHTFLLFLQFMKFTAIQIADILEGQIEGDKNVEVNKLSKIEDGEVGSLTFLSNPKYTPYIYSTKASLVIVNREFVAEKEVRATLIKVNNAYEAFSTLLKYYSQVKMNKSGIDEKTVISESAKIGKNLYLGSFSYIGNEVEIGDNVKIYPNVYIGDNVSIGDNTSIF